MDDNAPCPYCDTPVDPTFWRVGDVEGPGCPKCGATAKTLKDWNARRDITEPTEL